MKNSQGVKKSYIFHVRCPELYLLYHHSYCKCVQRTDPLFSLVEKREGGEYEKMLLIFQSIYHWEHFHA